MFAGMAALDRRNRIVVVRNAIRFPVLGTLLLYAYVPLVQSAGRLGPIITTPPGPWGGIVGGAGCLLGVIVYALLPALRAGTRPNARLADLHFFTAALACVGVFVGLFLAGADSIYVTDPELLERIAGFVRLRAVSGWVLSATALIPLVTFVLSRRSGAPRQDAA